MQFSQRLLSLVAYPVSEFRQKPGDLDAWHAPCSEWRAREQKTGASVMRNDPIRAGLTRRAALATAGATALAASIPPVRAAEGNTIRVAFPAPVATLDPAKFRVGGLEYNYAHCVFNRLTAQDAKLQVIPELAASWEATEDLKVWTFHLRPDVKFHNGKPFSADDVAFTYRRLMDKEGGLGPARRARRGQQGRGSRSAHGPLHAVGALFRPRRRHRAVPGPDRLRGGNGHADHQAGRHGAIPFRGISSGRSARGREEPDYFVAGSPKVDRAILRIIPEYTTAVAGLESGAIDIVYDLPPEQVDLVKDSKVARVEEVSTGTWLGVVFNNAFKPFDDPRVRAAFTKIVDRQGFTDIAMFGHGTPTVTPIPPTHPFFRADLLAPQDIPGAKKLLAEAGFPSGMSVEMFIPNGSPINERLGTAFRDAAKLAGVTVTLRVVPEDKFYAEMEGKIAFSVDGFFGRPTPDTMLCRLVPQQRFVEQHAVALQQSGGGQDPGCRA